MFMDIKVRRKAEHRVKRSKFRYQSDSKTRKGLTNGIERTTTVTSERAQDPLDASYQFQRFRSCESLSGRVSTIRVHSVQHHLLRSSAELCGQASRKQR